MRDKMKLIYPISIMREINGLLPSIEPYEQPIVNLEVDNLERGQDLIKEVVDALNELRYKHGSVEMTLLIGSKDYLYLKQARFGKQILLPEPITILIDGTEGFRFVFNNHSKAISVQYENGEIGNNI